MSGVQLSGEPRSSTGSSGSPGARHFEHEKERDLNITTPRRRATTGVTLAQGAVRNAIVLVPKTLSFRTGGRPGAVLELEISYRAGRKHLPIVQLKRVA
jgi:hypothetical protein